jgi:predicted metal-binding protein
MEETLRIGIIICDRYRRCAGGKCFSSFRKREGAFQRYRNKTAEIVGYTSCDGCPGGNIEYAAEEMIKNGASIIHLATGLLVGYPPCPHLEYFKKFLEKRYNIEVVYGTHPIPKKYLDMHNKLGTWQDPKWKEILHDTMTDEPTRLSYN